MGAESILTKTYPLAGYGMGISLKIAGFPFSSTTIALIVLVTWFIFLNIEVEWKNFYITKIN